MSGLRFQAKTSVGPNGCRRFSGSRRLRRRYSDSGFVAAGARAGLRLTPLKVSFTTVANRTIGPSGQLLASSMLRRPEFFDCLNFCHKFPLVSGSLFGPLPVPIEPPSVGRSSTGQPCSQDKGKPPEKAGRKATDPWVGRAILLGSFAVLQERRVAKGIAVRACSCRQCQGVSDESRRRGCPRTGRFTLDRLTSRRRVP